MSSKQPGSTKNAADSTKKPAVTASENGLDAQHLAEACANSMWQKDLASQGLGMQLESVAPGKASLSMTVGEHMTNGLKTCHGGYLFTLADSCFAFACNSYNQYAFAQHCSISYLAPAFEGDTLTAVASEQFSGGRSGLYDVSVHNQRGEKIAEFRGHSRTVKGHHIDVRE